MNKAAQLFNNREYFKTEEYRYFAVNLIQKLYQADQGAKGDLTADFLSEGKIHGAIYTREKCVIAGIEELSWAFPEVTFVVKKDDGETAQKGDLICALSGRNKDVLSAERTILNILSLMSAIATNTKKYVDEFSDKKTLLACTRKTIYGAMDKKAVTLGGGATHRINLSDAVIVKDTHLDGYKRDLTKFVREIDSARFVEIEVENENEAIEVAKLAKGHTNMAIMLDNFSPDEIPAIVQKIRSINSVIIIEASGGVTFDNLHLYKDSGLDILSSSSLNRELKFVDLTFKVDE